MKRYLLFAFNQYYPDGGWSDFVGAFDDIPAAVLAFHEMPDRRDFYHIVDTTTMELVIGRDGT